MAKSNAQFEFEKKQYPLEDALEKLVKEVAIVIKKIGWYIGRKPKDKMEMVVKSVELLIWSFLSYDLLRSIFGR